MPVLAANQVTLAEVLEVKGVPLNEEEVWAVLCQASKELELLLAKGEGKNHGQPALVISPETLILSHSGQVKVSFSSGREKFKSPTYRAPELNSRTVAPSDGAMEKMYVYSLGMTLYFAAEYQLTKSKMSHLSVSLGNLLLSMCEELARARYTLRQVLEACGSKYGQNSYSKIVKGLVVLVLGNNIPEVTQSEDILESKPRWRSHSSDYQHPSRRIRLRYGSSLELPSPPLVQRVSRGQATAVELVGSNERTILSPEEQQTSHSQNKFMTKIPRTLDKYRKHLEKARHKKSDHVTSPVVADRSMDLTTRYNSMSALNGRHSYGSEVPPRHKFERAQSYPEADKGYEEGPANGILASSRSEKLWTAGSHASLGDFPNAPSSDASSETSSLSDHRKSTISSAQSSSLMSLMEGSYVPGSSLTDHGSDFWGSMGSLRDSTGLARSSEWHHSSLGDLRSVSELSNAMDPGTKRYNDVNTMKQSPGSDGHRKYRSQQNLVTPDSSDGGRRRKKVPKAKLKKFLGPEFVQITEDPDRSFVNISPKKNEERASGRRLVTVVMLNEQRLEMAVESSTKVQELFTQITKYIGVTEKIYFGLARLEDDEHFFLDFDTKLSKYAPSGWKGKSKKSTGKYTLYFRVKFYVENISLLRHEETKHQLYLQLRSDILYNRLHCNQEHILNLASLALQAEYGDYSRKCFGEDYLKPRHYLPRRVLVKMTEDHASQKLRALHKIQCGLHEQEAELKFIKEAQKLPEYGMHFHKTQWNKNENQTVYLGVCVRGVAVFEPPADNKRTLEKHSWQMIKKLAFKKKKFCIEPREDGKSGKRNKITFLSSSYKRSKYLLYFCTSFHRFQMRMKVRLLSMDEACKAPDQKKGSSLGFSHKSESLDHMNGDGQLMNGTVQNDDLDSSFEERNADYTRRPSQVSRKEVNGFTDPSHDPSTVDHEQPDRASPYILDTTTTSPSAHSDKTPSPEAGKKVVTDVTLSPDRKVKAIKLKKDSRGALGLTVVGGEDTRRLHLGIFIKKISPGSVADEDGRLQVGDRILAVNGKSLEYVEHEEAVQILKNAGSDVELLVSQSTRTDSDIDLSALSSPTVDNSKLPSSRISDRASPYLVRDESSTPVNTNAVGSHDDDDPALTNTSQDPVSPKPPTYKNIHKPRRTSVSSSDMPESSPSSPERSSRAIHHRGIKLPGMDDERKLQDIRLSRHVPSTSSRASQISEESPGSIASFGKKVHEQNSVPRPASPQELHHELRKESLGSAPGDGRMGRSRSNSGVRPEDGGDGRLESSGGSVMSDVRARSRTPSVQEVQFDDRDGEGKLEKLPVGVVWENEARRTSKDENIAQKCFTVELDKESGSLGLNVTGGVNTSVKDGAVYVKSLYPNGPADLGGRIQIGHKIISVNGISLQGVTHKQAVETLKRAPVHTVLVIEGPPLEEHPATTQRDDGSRQSQNDEKERVFEVVLVKGIGGLGMSLVGGIDYSEEYGEELRIKAMFPGQPAENSEQLRVGDVILAANGVSLEGKTNRDAINVLRDQATRVVLLVKRDTSSIPISLLRRGSFSQNIDPNEVLSVIHSKLYKEDSQRSGQSMSSERSGYQSAGGPRSGGRRESLGGTRNGVGQGGSRKSSRGDLNGSDDDEHGLPLPDEQLLREAESSLTSFESLPPPPGVSDYGSGGDGVGEHAGQSFNERRLSFNLMMRGSHRTMVDGDDGDGTMVGGDGTMVDGDETMVGGDDGDRTMVGGDDGDGTMVGGDDGDGTMVVDDDGDMTMVGGDDGDMTMVGGDDGDMTMVGGHDDGDGTMVGGDDGDVTMERGGVSMVNDSFESQRGSRSQALNEPPLPHGNKKEKLAPDEEVVDLVLHKGSSGLGFTLAGGADTVGGCFVREIIGDPARSDGTLRAKDQIVMVNGQDTTNKKHMEAVNILRSTRNEVHLVIRRRPDKVKSKTKDGLDIKTVSVIRTTRGRIGLTLSEGKEGQIYAEDVVPDEPAAKDGGLKRGDIIMEINGERVDGTGLQFAEQCLDNARPVVTLVLKQFRTETESKYMLSSPTESVQDLPQALLLKDHAPGRDIVKPPELQPQKYNFQGQSQKYSQEKYLQEKHPQEKHPQEKYPQEKHLPEKRPQEKRPLGKRPQEKHSPEKHIQDKYPTEKSYEHPSYQRYPMVKQAAISPNKLEFSERQSFELLPSELLPLVVEPSVGQSPVDQRQNSGRFKEKYSRYNTSEGDEPAERAATEEEVDARLQVVSADSSGKQDELSEAELEDKVEDIEEEPRNEDYQDDDDDDDDVLLKEEVFATILLKGPRGLGFSLFSGRTILDVPGLFIRSIQPNSVVDEDGKIKIGDQLLKVNDEDVEKLNHSQVITMLRRLSGMVKLEMLRIYDGEGEEDEAAAKQPGATIQSHEIPSPDTNNEVVSNGAVSSVTIPDFTDDLGIVLNALDKNKDLPQSDIERQDSVNNPTETILNTRNRFESPQRTSPDKQPYSVTTQNDEKKVEIWPEPPTSIQLETSTLPNNLEVDYNDNLGATSEEDTASVTFSEDGFLEELEDSMYTPSPDSDVRRSALGNSWNQAILGDHRSSSTELEESPNLVGSRSGVSRIPVKQGSSLSKDLRTAFNNMENRKKSGRPSSTSGEENIETTHLKKPELNTSLESTPRTAGDNKVNAPSESVSPLIPESFLDPSQAFSSSQATSPDVPPPLPTTPIPSDDDLTGPKPPPRVQSLQGMTMRERFEKVVSEENMSKGRFDYSLRPKSPLIGRRLTSTQPTRPFIELLEPSPRYSGECLSHAVRKLEDSIASGKALDEFQALRELKPIDNCPSGKRALNKEKNRYRNVLPYEKTRVILSGDEQTDYINANYIDITVGSDVYRYIATQGPLPLTTNDFWKMVWEQKSQVIAMVTLDMESGKVKCHRYWPESPELPVQVNNSLEVHLESVLTHNNYVQRLIKIKNIENDECLTIIHLNFIAWPDHGVPKTAWELVDFIKHVRSRPTSGPYVVHCSAGIGRTGTLLTIDSCLKHVEKGLEFDIYSIVRRLREQRPGMVQTKDQYLFCYQACVEMLKSLQV